MDVGDLHIFVTIELGCSIWVMGLHGMILQVSITFGGAWMVFRRCDSVISRWCDSVVVRLGAVSWWSLGGSEALLLIGVVCWVNCHSPSMIVFADLMQILV